MFMHDFEFKKACFRTILPKVTNIFTKKLKNFLKTQETFPKNSIFWQIHYPCLPEKCPNDKPGLVGVYFLEKGYATDTLE